jgi:hypothetical protein
VADPAQFAKEARKMENESSRKISRRKLLEIAGGTVVLGGLYGLTFVDENAMAKLNIRPASKPSDIDLAVVQGIPTNYGDITERAIDEYGGIEKFVHKGDRVVLSPNMGWMRTPDQAATTHPDIIRRVVELCQRAGAARITCVDYTLDDWQLAFQTCGADQAVKGTEATLLSPTDPGMYSDVSIASVVPNKMTDGTPYTCVHHENRIYQKLPNEIIDCDSFICMPIVKDHEAATITSA